MFFKYIIWMYNIYIIYIYVLLENQNPYITYTEDSKHDSETEFDPLFIH